MATIFWRQNISKYIAGLDSETSASRWPGPIQITFVVIPGTLRYAVHTLKSM